MYTHVIISSTMLIILRCIRNNWKHSIFSQVLNLNHVLLRVKKEIKLQYLW